MKAIADLSHTHITQSFMRFAFSCPEVRRPARDRKLCSSCSSMFAPCARGDLLRRHHFVTLYRLYIRFRPQSAHLSQAAKALINLAIRDPTSVKTSKLFAKSQEVKNLSRQISMFYFSRNVFLFQKSSGQSDETTFRQKSSSLRCSTFRLFEKSWTFR